MVKDLRQIKKKVGEKYDFIKSDFHNILNTHFKRYPWGVLASEASDYLINLKTSGTYLDDRVLKALAKIEKEAGPDIFEATSFVDFKQRMVHYFRELCLSEGIETARDTTLLQMFRHLNIADRSEPVDRPTSLNMEFSVRKALADRSEYLLLERRVRNFFRNSLNMRLTERTRSKSRSFESTPLWKQVCDAILSPQFAAGIGQGSQKRGLLHAYVKEASIFCAPSVVQAWARVFLETELDLKKLKAEARFPSCAGYLILKKLRDGPMSFNKLLDRLNVSSALIRTFRSYLKSLNDTHLVTFKDGYYSLNKEITVKAFAHMEKHSGKGKDPKKWPKTDIRHWHFRRDILYPPTTTKYTLTKRNRAKRARQQVS